MPPRFDVIVLGLGAMGSAAAFHLARAGYDVLGLDRHHPPHPYGSSHGHTRVIRNAYFEDPAYVPWVERAWDLWRELEQATGTPIVEQTGGLHLGTPSGTQVPGAREALSQHGYDYESLDARGIRERFPVFRPDPEHEAVFEETAGYVRVDEAIRSHLTLAHENGADLVFGEQAWGWREHPSYVRVSTHEGNAYLADDVVVALGPWLPKHVAELEIGFSVERRVQFVIDPPMELNPGGQELFPVFTFEPDPGIVFYGVPLPDGRVKVALHHAGQETDPDDVERHVDQEDEGPLRELLEEHAPGLDGPVEETMVCLYTNTPDAHFLLDRHPSERRTLLVSPCSGHGFKFSPAIGEAVLELVSGRSTSLDRSLFAVDRFLEEA